MKLVSILFFTRAKKQSTGTRARSSNFKNFGDVKTTIQQQNATVQISGKQAYTPQTKIESF